MASAARPIGGKVARIAELIRDIDVTDLAIWDDLDILSTHTFVDDVEVLEDGIVIRPDDTFSGVFNIYVSLQYGANNDEGFTTSDSFLVSFDGHFEDNQPVIDSSSVDTSAFYE